MTADLDFMSLPPAEAEHLARLHPELLGDVAAGASMFVVTASDANFARAVGDALSALRLVAPSNVSMEALIAAMTPTPVAGRGCVVQAQRNAALRAALASEFGILTGSEVASLADSAAKNSAATAARWRKNGMIFCVPVAGSRGYPAFQFDGSGRPLLVVAEIIAELGEQMDPWSLALWFISNNSYLRGARPVDVLDSDPAPVLLAAKRAAEPIGW